MADLVVPQGRRLRPPAAGLGAQKEEIGLDDVVHVRLVVPAGWQPPVVAPRRVSRPAESATASDARFAALLQQSDVFYEFVHEHGMGSLLIATARPSGPLTWK